VHPDLRLPVASATAVAFDCEMTGLDPRRDAVCAIGAVRIREGRITEETFDVLIDPARPMGAAAERIHGLTDARLQGQPRIDEVLPAFRAFLADSIPVAHIGSLDLAFLAPALRRSGLPSIERVLDTAVLARTLMPAQHDITLEGLCAYFDVPLDGRHTALGDASLAARLYLRFVADLERRGVTALESALPWGDAYHAFALR
jgi:DNA polymerase III subunit epsilon